MSEPMGRWLVIPCGEGEHKIENPCLPVTRERDEAQAALRECAEQAPVWRDALAFSIRETGEAQLMARLAVARGRHYLEALERIAGQQSGIWGQIAHEAIRDAPDDLGGRLLADFEQIERVVEEAAEAVLTDHDPTEGPPHPSQIEWAVESAKRIAVTAMQKLDAV